MSTPMYDVPEHFPIGVTADGVGPVDEHDEDYDHTTCWCSNEDCELWRQV